ncbi:TetR family transcriptional regulator [Vibrio fortis]|uniref:TetR family transcriptional regulator n=1 Tax=Vibrio fortis TaxID=212667 RepID=A0A066V1L4_9VIBR|nr:TetR/AcrR family transcriptional regulator [Vibrio fortis]KDN30458.1 TetR family transcriptional regulator [Vibrio fortis]
MTVKKTLSQKKREAIVEAAIAEFTENGYKSTSMDKISARAEVSKRTVYNHFASKELLLDEILDSIWTKTLAATHFPYQQELSMAEQLTAIANQELDLLESEGFINLSRVLFSEYFHNKELAYQAMEKYSQAESGLTIWIKAALADERLIELDPHFASTQFIALLKSFAFWPQIIGHAPSPDKAQRNHIIDSSVQMFLKQYQR